jgi:hypothetical protein
MKEVTLYILTASFILAVGEAAALAQGAPTNAVRLMRFSTSAIRLDGESRGGVLTLMKVPAWNYPYVAVTNRPGDSASVVVERLASAISNCSACTKFYGDVGVVQKSERSLVLIGAGEMSQGFPDWVLGGTDMGFNIPPAPAALSASWDSNRVTLTWINEAVYDSMGVFIDALPVASLPGTATQFVLDEHNVMFHVFRSRSADVTLTIMASRGGTPSNCTGIRLKNQKSQGSLMNVPFTDGIAPGFERWTYGTEAGHISFEEGKLPGVAPDTDLQEFQGKGFFQVLRGRGPLQGGVLRRFIGLNPGHAYRVGARIRVPGAAGDAWSFSLHAAANPPGESRLSEAQMAGRVELPSGNKGPNSAQVARYDSAHYTKGQWATLSSGVPGADNQAGDVSLPAGSDSMTIWFRVEGSDGGDVTAAFDSLTLEDLGSK